MTTYNQAADLIPGGKEYLFLKQSFCGLFQILETKEIACENKEEWSLPSTLSLGRIKEDSRKALTVSRTNTNFMEGDRIVKYVKVNRILLCIFFGT